MRLETHRWEDRTLTDVIAHWLDRKTYSGVSDRTAPVTNPATGRVTGTLTLADRDDVLRLFNDNPYGNGTEGVHFFIRGRAVTSRWLDPSHGGTDFAFPENS